MKPKLIALNIGLALSIGLIAWQARVKWDDAQADRRIDPQPAGPHDKQRSNDHAKRNSGVRYHVQISSANIQVAMTTSHEQQSRRTVHNNSQNCNIDDGLTDNRRRMLKSPDGFGGDAADGKQ